LPGGDFSRNSKKKHHMKSDESEDNAMYISIRDSATTGFKNWSAARPNASTTDFADDGLAVAAAGAAGENAVVTGIEPPRGPWLVPGPGTL
jgi:hypothetical protein